KKTPPTINCNRRPLRKTAAAEQRPDVISSDSHHLPSCSAFALSSGRIGPAAFPTGFALRLLLGKIYEQTADPVRKTPEACTAAKDAASGREWRRSVATGQGVLRQRQRRPGGEALRCHIDARSR